MRDHFLEVVDRDITTIVPKVEFWKAMIGRKGQERKVNSIISSMNS